MFVKNINGLVFIKSANIKVFPCGRRRSNLIDRDGSDATVNDRYYIPFDPEARLNTEANNRKHSGLNGFKQNYLNYWRSAGELSSLSLVLKGYLFDIQLTADCGTLDGFGNALATEKYLGKDINSIYVNIKLADVKFFEGTDTIGEAATEVLRDQVLTGSPATCLDFLIDDIEDIKKSEDVKKSENYYFSGLSFSATPLAEKSGEVGVKSLQLLAKDTNGWHICNSARLPKIDHGDVDDSISVGTIKANGDIKAAGNIDTTGIVVSKAVRLGTDSYVPIMKVQKNEENGNWQLQFSIPKE